MNTIRQNNADYNNWLSEKQSRMNQVRLEIAQETAKETIDPNALGVRYAEIEGICRQMRDKATDLKNTNISVLTDVQKTQLKVLDDAMKLAPLISQAQSLNLLDGTTTGVFSFLTSVPILTTTPAYASLLLGTPAPTSCTTVPTVAVRSGDFAARP